MGFRIILAKDDCKFSASHFTIFGRDQAERLHGHNYYVSCELEVGKLAPTLGMAFDFNFVKPILKRIAQSLDDFILLPERSEFLKIAKNLRQIEVRFGSKHYVFPEDDVKLLPLVNITSEELARHLAELVWNELKNTAVVTSIERLSIGVEETRGQSVVFDKRINQ